MKLLRLNHIETGLELAHIWHWRNESDLKCDEECVFEDDTSEFWRYTFSGLTTFHIVGSTFTYCSKDFEIFVECEIDAYFVRRVSKIHYLHSTVTEQRIQQLNRELNRGPADKGSELKFDNLDYWQADTWDAAGFAVCPT